MTGLGGMGSGVYSVGVGWIGLANGYLGEYLCKTFVSVMLASLGVCGNDFCVNFPLCVCECCGCCLDGMNVGALELYL